MKCSIIIPVYDEEDDISNCLVSLTSQTFKDFEIIIVDDGSKDYTLNMVKQCIDAYDLDIKILEQDHEGPGAARNLGAQHAKGDILIFIDADMTFEPNYINNLIKPLSPEQGEWFGTTHDNEIATNTDNIWSRLWGKIRVSPENATDVKIFRAIKKKTFIDMGGFDPKYGYADDQTLWFKYKLGPTVSKNTKCYHNNPDTLMETFKQARWIGTSWPARFKIFDIRVIRQMAVLVSFILLPFAILAKTFLQVIKKRVGIWNGIKFYSCKFTGYLVGVARAIFMERFSK